VIRKVVSGQETQYVWDYEDKMVKIVYPNGSTNEFETNYEGKRRKKVDSTGVTYFYYDRENLLAETDENDNLMAVYEWGVRGLLSQFRDGVRYYYHLDGLGSVVQVTNETQVVVASYKYDAWGNDLVDPQSLIPNPFKYMGGLGYYSDRESGLKLLGVRYYDSQIGRFWSMDPIKEGQNWYGYVENNPVNLVDPTGLSVEGWLCRQKCWAIYYLQVGKCYAVYLTWVLLCSMLFVICSALCGRLCDAGCRVLCSWVCASLSGPAFIICMGICFTVCTGICYIICGIVCGRIFYKCLNAANAWLRNCLASAQKDLNACLASCPP